MPPLADRLYLVPSEPVSVTALAFVAPTVRMEELPAVIEAGLAAMVTAGAGGVDGVVTVTDAVPEALPPAPVALAV